MRQPRRLAPPPAAAPNVASAPPVGIPNHAPSPPDVVAERRELVSNLLLVGASSARILQVTSMRGYSPAAVHGDIAALRLEQVAEAAAREKDRRAFQLARLHNSLVKMHSSSPVPWAAIGVHEKLVAEIEGNLAPRRMQIEVSAVPQALAASVASMTNEDAEAILAEELERERRLRTIDTTASPAP